MAVFSAPVQPFKWKPDGGTTGVPQIKHYPAGQGTAGAAFPYWSYGQVLQQVVTGTVTAPNPNGILVNFAGPVAFSNAAQLSVVTVTFVATAGAPSLTLWAAVTYTDAGGDESQVSPLLPIGVPAGFTVDISVSAAGAPVGATQFNVYAGLFPRQWFSQVTHTALGGTAVLAYPLTNYAGMIAAPAGASTNLIGMSDSAFDQVFDPLSAFPGRRNPFGATMSTDPLMGTNALWPVLKLGAGTFELNLVQAFSNALIGAAVGLNIDAATGRSVWDTTQTQVATIVEQEFGMYQGGLGVPGTRVFARFLPTVII
jgi:hypothetical protein